MAGPPAEGQMGWGRCAADAAVPVQGMVGPSKPSERQGLPPGLQSYAIHHSRHLCLMLVSCQRDASLPLRPSTG